MPACEAEAGPGQVLFAMGAYGATPENTLGTLRLRVCDAVDEPSPAPRWHVLAPPGGGAPCGSLSLLLSFRPSGSVGLREASRAAVPVIQHVQPRPAPPRPAARAGPRAAAPGSGGAACACTGCVTKTPPRAGSFSRTKTLRRGSSPSRRRRPAPRPSSHSRPLQPPFPPPPPARWAPTRGARWTQVSDLEASPLALARALLPCLSDHNFQVQCAAARALGARAIARRGGAAALEEAEEEEEEEAARAASCAEVLDRTGVMLRAPGGPARERALALQLAGAVAAAAPRAALAWRSEEGLALVPAARHPAPLPATPRAPSRDTPRPFPRHPAPLPATPRAGAGAGAGAG